MEALCRLLELAKGGPIPDGFEDPQTSEDEYSLDRNASELISIHPDLVIAERWSDALQGSPKAVSSLPEIFTPNDAHLSDDFHQLPSLLSTPANDWHHLTQQNQLNSKSPYLMQPLSTSPVKNPDPAPMSIKYSQTTEAPSIPQIISLMDQSKCMGGRFYPHPELVATSARHHPSVYSNPKSHFPNTTDHLHGIREKLSSPWVLDTLERLQVCDDSRLPQKTGTKLQVPHTLAQESIFEEYAGQFYSTPRGTGKAEQSQYEDFDLPSGSPEIDTPKHTESSGGELNQLSRLIAVPPLADDNHFPKLNDDDLRQRLELISTSRNPAGPEKAHPLCSSMHQPLEPISTLSTSDTTTAQTQFNNVNFPQDLEEISTLLASNKPDHSQSNEVEQDLSPVEYARKNGLSRDYLKEPYVVSHLEIPGDCQGGLTDDSNLPHFKLTANVTTDERLAISKEAACLIASISHEESSEWVEDTVYRMIDTRKYRKLRIELPLLKSDHETDCKKFAQRDGFEIKMQDIKLPLETVEEGNTLGFSPSKWCKGAEILEVLKKEKLEVSRHTLVYLQNNLKNDWTDEDEKRVWQNVLKYKRNTSLKFITPPLSPMIFPTQTYEPSMSDPVFELPILSDPESLAIQDLEFIQEQIFKNDVPTPIKDTRVRGDESSDSMDSSDTIKMADIYSPAASLDRTPAYPTMELARAKREGLKVEEPLTPTKPADLPKTSLFDDVVMEWPLATGSSPPKDPFESSYFQDAFGDAYENATRASEQEALIPADTKARVEVPVMDFSLPTLPWSLRIGPASNSIFDMQKNMMKNVIGQCLPKWPSHGTLKVRYNPFPHDLAQVAFEEKCLDNDSTWQVFIEDLEGDTVMKTSILTWKPQGLRILKENDDDEIESAQFENGLPKDFANLIKKRKMEIEERDNGSGLAPATQDAITNAITNQPPRRKTRKQTQLGSKGKQLQSDLVERGGNLLLGSSFSVGNLVDNFLEIRGTKKSKLGESSSFTKASVQVPAPATANSPSELLMQLPLRNSPHPNKIESPLPAPPSTFFNNHVNVIVASTLLKCRSLIRHIELLSPQIILVERDFSAHDTTMWMPGSVARSPVASPLVSEADIIVSPLVGIIIANLQKIKQKPLPGQETQVAIRERVEKVSVRYERLIVLVTEGRQDETTRELDDGDCTAFSEFVAFASSLPNTINVQFIGGGEASLAKWTVSAISSHRADVELLADETHWELFLRRAGLNAFAAQAIILRLKAPDGIDLSSPSTAAHFGLVGFVEMGMEQRIARFGPVCGNGLMERLSAVIDAWWS